MADRLEVKELDQVVVRFSGDSGDGMQLAGEYFLYGLGDGRK